MRYTAALLLVATLSLAACQQTEPNTLPGDARANADPAAMTSPTFTPAALPTTARVIPERFRGVWDNARSKCSPSSNLRMDIGAVSIEFYESLGNVTGVTVEAPDSIVVDLAMEGEGERWEVKNRYTLSNEGATLTPTDLSHNDGAIVIPRKRCQS